MFNRSNGFLLIEFQFSWSLQLFLFSLLLVAYLTTLAGNFLVIVLSWNHHSLHTPMYFFLFNLSILEIGATTSVTPKLLSILVFGNRAISFWGCLTQCTFYFFLGSVDFFLLAVMSFDRYVAICHPLHYVTVMNHRLCMHLAVGCWLGGLADNIAPTILFSFLTFCGPNSIEHFFCDIDPLLKLVCQDISLMNLTSLLASSVTILGSFTCIAVSYTFIILAVFQIPSDGQRWKTFSTCSSHLILVSVFYTGSGFMCLRYIKGAVIDFSKMAVVLNTIITPLLNPFIYTLRNNQVKCALKGLLGLS